MTRKDPEAQSDKTRRKAEAAARLVTLEARLERIEAALQRRSAAAEAAPASAEGGSGPRFAKSEAAATGNWEAAAPRLAALGHPVRLRVLKAALQGSLDVTALLAGSGVGSSGQLYHHLKELTAQGWLEPAGRGRYGVPSARRAALLSLMALVL